MANSTYYWIDYQYATHLYVIHKVNQATKTTEKVAEFNNIDEAENALSELEKSN
jgi:hypothetical protein